MNWKNSMKCKNLNEGEKTFNKIQNFNEMQELSEGKNLFNEIQNF